MYAIDAKLDKLIDHKVIFKMFKYFEIINPLTLIINLEEKIFLIVSIQFNFISSKKLFFYYFYMNTVQIFDNLILIPTVFYEFDLNFILVSTSTFFLSPFNNMKLSDT